MPDVLIFDDQGNFRFSFGLRFRFSSLSTSLLVLFWSAAVVVTWWRRVLSRRRSCRLLGFSLWLCCFKLVVCHVRPGASFFFHGFVTIVCHWCGLRFPSASSLDFALLTLLCTYPTIVGLHCLWWSSRCRRFRSRSWLRRWCFD